MILCFDVGPLRDMVGGVDWYLGLRKDVEKSKAKVLVAGGEYQKQISKALMVKRWLLSLERKGQLQSLKAGDVELRVNEIKAQPEANCGECDDHHLFAMCYVGRADYLFTQDVRLSVCREKMNRNVKLKKFCGVRLICGKKTYDSHRHKIL